MSRVYINKGKNEKDGKWVGAAVFHDDDRLELLGAFAPVIDTSDEEEKSIYRGLWESEPTRQMMVGTMQGKPDELVVEDDASDEVVEEALNGKYVWDDKVIL